MARFNGMIIPIVDLFLVSAGSPVGNVVLPANTRALLVGNSGVLNITIADTEYDLVPFVAGLQPGFFQAVRAGGSASNVWAVL